MAALLEARPAPLVLEVGLAGGLERTLAHGDVVVCLGVTRAGSNGRWSLDAGLAGRAMAALAGAGIFARAIDIVESPRLVARAEDKRALYASSRAVAVSMETAAIALAAEGVPHLALRVVFDTVDEDVALTDELIDGEGRVRPGALVRTLVARPKTTVALVRSGLRARTALDRLARAVAAVWPTIS